MLLVIFLAGTFLHAASIDIGIFEAEENNKVEIRLKPDFEINTNQTISSILYTLKWDDPSVSFSLNYIFPYLVIADGDAVYHNGYVYQVFVAIPMNPVGETILPGDEMIVSAFTYTGGDCTFFEIAMDDWTAANNGDYYCALQGTDVTGIIYESILRYGSYGGEVIGGGDIYLAQNTGLMQLNDHFGHVEHWQRRFENGDWENISGTTGLTEYNETPAEAGLWQYRVAIKHNNCPVAYSTKTSVLVLAATEWAGSMNCDWHHPDNWLGMVPQPNLDVIIPEVASGHYPVIINHTECLNLFIHPEASLTVGPQASLVVHGSLVNEAGFNALIIQSDPDGTGSLIHNNTGVQAIFQKYVPGWSNWPLEQQPYQGWQLLSSMVENQAIQPDFVSDPPYGNEQLLKWDESQHKWINSVTGTQPPFEWNTDFEPSFVQGRGYLTARQNTTVHEFKGTLRVEDVHLTGLSHTGGHERPQAGWHLLGNPFASAISWFDGNWAREQLGAYAQRWDPQNASYKVIIEDNGIIDAAEGFMVYVKPEVNGSLTIPANARKQNISEIKNNQANQRIVLTAEDTAGNTAQQTIIQVNPDASFNFEPAYDATFIQGFAPAFYSLSDDQMLLALNTIPYINPEQSIMLGFENNHPGQFNLVLQESIAGLKVLLNDQKLNLVHDFQKDTSYTFSAESDDDPFRFRLLFAEDETMVGENNTERLQVFVSGNTLFVINPHLEKVSIKIFDLSGNTVNHIKTAGEAFYSLALNLPAGIYVLHTSSSKGGNDYLKIYVQ